MKIRLPSQPVVCIHILFAFAFLISGCATSLRAIKRDSLTYEKSIASSDVSCQYKFDVLGESGNIYYARRADRLGVAVVAVKLKNNLDRELDVGSDLEFSIDGKAAFPASPYNALRGTMQKTGLYSLYLIGALFNIYGTSTECSNYDCHTSTSFIPVGLIIAPVLSFGNMIVASSANQGIMKEFGENDLKSRKIKPGETLSGYLTFTGVEGTHLAVRVRAPNEQGGKSSSALPSATPSSIPSYSSDKDFQ